MTLIFISNCILPMPFALFTMHGFSDESGNEHIALTLNKVNDGIPVLCRLHSECLSGDALFSMRCDCGYQLQEALRRIAKEGRGVLIYLRQEGRGIGLINKIRAYNLQDKGYDTIEANCKLGFKTDLRKYKICIPILNYLGIKSLKLLTNNKNKITELLNYGIDIIEIKPLITGITAYNKIYIKTKLKKLDHILEYNDYIQNMKYK